MARSAGAYEFRVLSSELDPLFTIHCSLFTVHEVIIVYSSVSEQTKKRRFKVEICALTGSTSQVAG